MSLNAEQQSALGKLIDSGYGAVEIDRGGEITDSNGTSGKRRQKKSSGISTDSIQPSGADLAYAYLNGELKIEYRTYLDLDLGWNSRANYKQPIIPGTVIGFRIPAYSVGVIVGLTSSPSEYGYADFDFGVVQSISPATRAPSEESTTANASVRLVRSGQFFSPEQPEVSADDEATFQALADGGFTSDLFPLDLDASSWRHELHVFADRVEYWIDDGTAKFKAYTANVQFSTQWQLSAAFYSGGDKVWDVTFEQDVAEPKIPPIKVFASDVADLTIGRPELPRFMASGEDFIEDTYADLTLATIRPVGGDDVSIASVELPRFTSYGIDTYDNDPLVDYTFTFADLPQITVEASAVDVTFASADLSLKPVAVFASDSDVTLGRVDLPPMTSAGYDRDSDTRVEIVEIAYLIQVSAGFEAYYLVWNERLEAVGLISATAVERALIEARMNAGSPMTASEIIQALLASVMSASDVANLIGEPLEVWALHMDAMGSTRYEGYNFNSFATIDGVTYGAAEDGVYRLDGDDDAGTAIQSLVDFGSLSFGTNNRKALPYVYVGMASGGKTILKVESDGKTYFYEVRDSTEGMKTHRFELGRGLRSTFYGLTLISEGPAFDLHNIEFQPIELTRRL